ncbi:hypothetical protein [Mucilaginibacter mallensis]|nr:hypothetical protein [Mucilaginibacter mallensis]
MLLCRTGPTLQIRQNLGWNLFAAILRTILCAAKISYALPRTRPPSFCLISPEAVLLTGEEKASSNFQKQNTLIEP